MTYENLKRRAHQLRKDGELPATLTAEERADWAYGNAVIENDSVTREMAVQAVATRRGGK